LWGQSAWEEFMKTSKDTSNSQNDSWFWSFYIFTCFFM
jgi:hypothetical protein